MTPVGRAGLMFGKFAPYAAWPVATLIVLSVMVYIFGSVHGWILLLWLASLFVVCPPGPAVGPDAGKTQVARCSPL